MGHVGVIQIFDGMTAEADIGPTRTGAILLNVLLYLVPDDHGAACIERAMIAKQLKDVLGLQALYVFDFISILS
jgi:hypothetical protein